MIIGIPCAHLMSNPVKEVSAGLNAAIRQARGETVFRIDAHCEYQQDYITSCLKELRRTGAANVGGLLETLPGARTWMSLCIAGVSKHPIGVGNGAFRIGKGDEYVDTVPFGAFRKAVFKEIGLFREDLPRNQDYELNSRLRNAGYRLYLSSKIRTQYYNSPTVAAFMRQACTNGWFAVRCWLANRQSFCWRHAAPSLCTTLGAILIGLSMVSRFAKLFTIICVLLYGATILYVGIQLGTRRNWRTVFIAPCLIATYHSLYGVSTIISGLFAILSMLSNKAEGYVKVLR
jgi:hypothetical protein